mmetsp:Transcript_28907/g.83824  ORF Transcript_28907/g.83824 Transcript_28907/m.83824 type:complete len:557 (-) Transcript_28907:128-1798(-)
MLQHSPRARSYCVIHPESEFTDQKFRHDNRHVELEGADDAGACFDRVFSARTSQDVIFQEVAKSAVQAAVDRFRSTTFIAFGPSGCGKTFAITGGAKRFADRGLIPRGISALFDTLAARPDRGELDVSISFYELYKGVVIDLLSEKRRKVVIQPSSIDDPGCRRAPSLVGLLRHGAASESDAYHLLFQGDSSRHFERFPRNPETSRGHVFYVVHLVHAPTSRQATLNFVDLAAAIEHRNPATSAIERSLEALREVLAALRSRRNPDYDASPLTQLLRPCLQPDDPASPEESPGVVLIAPVRYSLQLFDEVRDSLEFARLFQEAIAAAGSGEARGPLRKAVAPAMAASAADRSSAVPSACFFADAVSAESCGAEARAALAQATSGSAGCNGFGGFGDLSALAEEASPPAVRLGHGLAAALQQGAHSSQHQLFEPRPDDPPQVAQPRAQLGQGRREQSHSLQDIHGGVSSHQKPSQPSHTSALPTPTVQRSLVAGTPSCAACSTYSAMATGAAEVSRPLSRTPTAASTTTLNFQLQEHQQTQQQQQQPMYPNKRGGSG